MTSLVRYVLDVPDAFLQPRAETGQGVSCRLRQHSNDSTRERSAAAFGHNPPQSARRDLPRNVIIDSSLLVSTTTTKRRYTTTTCSAPRLTSQGSTLSGTTPLIMGHLLGKTWLSRSLVNHVFLSGTTSRTSKNSGKLAGNCSGVSVWTRFRDPQPPERGDGVNLPARRSDRLQLFVPKLQYGGKGLAAGCRFEAVWGMNRDHGGNPPSEVDWNAPPA